MVTPRPVALSLLMEGEDFGFWQKLKYNAYTHNKTLWMPQRIELKADFSFLCFCCPKNTKKILWLKKQRNNKKKTTKRIPTTPPKKQKKIASQKISQHKQTSKQTKRSIRSIKQLELFLESKGINTKLILESGV